MIRELIPDSNPILHEPAAPFEWTPDEEDQARTSLAALVSDLFETMETMIGCGLAAPQIGVPLQVFVLRTKNKELVCINPKLIAELPDTEVEEEGCLSYPDQYVLVRRSTRIKVEYLDRDLKRRIHYLNDDDARVWAHEYDHLRGVVMLERAEPKADPAS